MTSNLGHVKQNLLGLLLRLKQFLDRFVQDQSVDDVKTSLEASCHVDFVSIACGRDVGDRASHGFVCWPAGNGPDRGRRKVTPSGLNRSTVYVSCAAQVTSAIAQPELEPYRKR